MISEPVAATNPGKAAVGTSAGILPIRNSSQRQEN